MWNLQEDSVSQCARTAGLLFMLEGCTLVGCLWWKIKRCLYVSNTVGLARVSMVTRFVTQDDNVIVAVDGAGNSHTTLQVDRARWKSGLFNLRRGFRTITFMGIIHYPKCDFKSGLDIHSLQFEPIIEKQYNP